MKLLIVEDQMYTLEALELAVQEAGPKYGFEKHDVARCYDRAKEMIESDSYKVILLDHRMPKEDQGTLEKTNSRKFRSRLQDIGYGLIPLIRAKDPETVIIGTSSMMMDPSSMSPAEIRAYKLPDHQIDKTSSRLKKDLEKILKTLKGA